MPKASNRSTDVSKDLLRIHGFLKTPKKTASGIYRGRYTFPEVQWTGSPPDLCATFTVTAEELADAAASQLLWTDQDVQRGVKPGLPEPAPRELSLAAGYPDPALYIFSSEKADAIVEKLLAGEKVFLNPLVWNLRPGDFTAYWNPESKDVYLYTGRIYLPDSHHRQQAIVRAVKAWRDAPSEYPRFSGSRQFKIELYFLSREDEGNYFFDKNQLPKPTAKSKAYDLTTLDDLSMLAKRVIQESRSLRENVNRVTDRLTAKNPQVMTLSTLREMMRGFVEAEELDVSEFEGSAVAAARFYDLLASVRPELGHLLQPERQRVREKLVVDAAVMMHGYAALMRDFRDEIAKAGLSGALRNWERKLSKLSQDRVYSIGTWSGDFFDKKNPLWGKVGIVKPGRDRRRLTVLNTGGARLECGRVLRSLIALGENAKSLESLTVR